MQDRVFNNDKIEILFECKTLGLSGEAGAEGAHLVRRKGEPDEETFDIAIDGFFLAIGHRPNSELFRGQLELDETGYILTESATPCTSNRGGFAAGDGADPNYRQAIVAAASGCKAAMEAERYLQAEGH